jgi:hypothetical protein
MTHATDLARAEQTVSLHAGLLLAFSIGASTGPIMASLAMQEFGSGGLYAFGAGMNVLLALFIIYRKTMRASKPHEKQTGFVAMPQTIQTSPAVAGLDPRMPEAGAPHSARDDDVTPAKA